MQIEAGDLDFIVTKLPWVDGWLVDAAAQLTCALARMQSEAGITGGFFEIGVYVGKYLSLLYHLSESTGERVVGVDTFEWCPLSGVEQTFARLFGQTTRLELVAADSTKISAEDVISRLKGKPRFISVDGAHTSAAVLNDLKLSEQILADGGIVAIDDFLNPRAIGVGEGAYRYFLGRGEAGLAPFAYRANKLFVARRGDLPRFRNAVWRFIEMNPTLAVTIEARELLEKGRHWVEQELLGQPVVFLILPQPK